MKGSRLLLDTHVFLWWRANPRRIKPAVRESISVADVVFVSAATAWEAGIKSALGRLVLPESVELGVQKSGFERMPILFSHAVAAASLPSHHLDPFDRMLVGQARCEQLVLVSHDRSLEPYDVEILWV